MVGCNPSYVGSIPTDASLKVELIGFPLIPNGTVMELAYILLLESRFCGFDSHLCHQIRGKLA